jgi:hypothetical protein
MFSFGSDPEVFIAKDGKIVNATKVLPNKENKICRGSTSVYYDNVLAELQVSPAETASEAIHNFRKAFQLLQNTVSDHEIVIESAHWFVDSELDNEESRVVGCNSEFCAYTLEQRNPPQDVIKTTGFRTAGGHIHLGKNDLFQDSKDILSTIRMLDLFVGIPSVLIDHDTTQKYRRKIYGHAGSHRIPDHGVEYRCLGNFWIKSPQLVELIYDLTCYTISFVEDGQHKKFWNTDASFDEDIDQNTLCFGYDSKQLQNCINNCDKRKAEKFMHIVNCHLPRDLAYRIEDCSQINFDFYHEWGLDCSDS